MRSFKFGVASKSCLLDSLCQGEQWYLPNVQLPRQARLAGRVLLYMGKAKASQLSFLYLNTADEATLRGYRRVTNPGIAWRFQTWHKRGGLAMAKHKLQISWVWLKIKELGLRGFSLCCHLPGFHFGYPFLTHSQLANLRTRFHKAAGDAPGPCCLASV